MNVEDLMKNLEDAIEKSPTIPIWGRGIVDKEDLLDLLAEVKNALPEELSSAKYIMAERQRLISEAEEEAKKLVKAAEDKIVAMVNEHDITQQAQAYANEIIDNANQNAHDIRLGANKYADDLLKDIENSLIQTAETLRANRTGSM